MGDFRKQVEGTADEFASAVNDESLADADDPIAGLPDDPRAEFVPIEDDVNDLEAALNPDGQFVEPLPALDEPEQMLAEEEGRAGD